MRGFGAVLDGPRPHLLIEHLEGPTLRRLIRRGGPIPLEQLLPLAAHVGAALRYMELNGVAHLDVKPDNIVMGIPPRLIDLSIARPLDRAARIRSPVGTDAYMPPEQCDPSGHPGEIGAPADVWGLGATLHHALRARRASAGCGRGWSVRLAAVVLGGVVRRSGRGGLRGARRRRGLRGGAAALGVVGRRALGVLGRRGLPALELIGGGAVVARAGIAVVARIAYLDGSHGRRLRRLEEPAQDRDRHRAEDHGNHQHEGRLITNRVLHERSSAAWCPWVRGR